MKKLFILTCLLLSFVIVLSSCSFKDVKKEINNVLGKEEMTIINGFEVPIDAVDKAEYYKADDVRYLEIGDTVEDYILISNSTDGDIELGTKGLFYTLNGVTVYNTFDDAKISEDELSLMYEGDNLIEIKKNNKFLVADITATYSSEGTDVFTTGFDLVEAIWTDRGKSLTDIRPTMVWFSNHPAKDDEELDFAHKYFVYRIKPNEPTHLKIGMFVGNSYINAKDVFLIVDGPSEITEGYTPTYFRLISDKTVFMSKEGTI